MKRRVGVIVVTLGAPGESVGGPSDGPRPGPSQGSVMTAENWCSRACPRAHNVEGELP